VYGADDRRDVNVPLSDYRFAHHVEMTNQRKSLRFFYFPHIRTGRSAQCAESVRTEANWMIFPHRGECAEFNIEMKLTPCGWRFLP